MKPTLKKILTYAGIVLFFLVLAYGFVPQVLSGKVVNQTDIVGYSGMAHEMSTWNNAHPHDHTAWTDSMFGGMPTTIISAPREGDWTQHLYDLLLTGRRPATYLFLSLLGGFLLMLSLGINTILAVGGAVAVTFCSYNLQIIQVGHNTKMQAIAYLPWVLAACIYTYRSALGLLRGAVKGGTWRKWLPRTVLGAVLFAFALSFQIKANHQQITYYLAIAIFIFALSEFIWLLIDKSRRALLGRFFTASALLLVLGIAGIATNTTKLVPVYNYTGQSMRGGSELSSSENHSGSGPAGLSIDYATQWSYGWEELPNLMIPNFNGGSSSGAVNPSKSATIQLLRDYGQPNLREVSRNLPLYWGPQPFTAGPMYMGAITVFLFVLGLMLCDGRDKWWLAVCTLLAVLLGLGSHLMWFTELFFNNVPFYNKFRTVTMILSLLQVTLPVMGFLALDKTVRGGVSREVFVRKGLTAFALTGGLCLIFALMPGLAGSFTSASDRSYDDILAKALAVDRRSLLVSDAIRSFVLIAAAFCILLWSFMVPKGAEKSFAAGSELAASRRMTAAVLVCMLILVDLFATGKRYLNSNDFVTKQEFTSAFTKRPVDEYILSDPDLSYRVVDLSGEVFSDVRSPYWHKSVGGYSPAKLQRYDELIKYVLTPELETFLTATQKAATISELEDSIPQMPVLSALNARYFILGDDMSPVVNSSAYGNAWFVAKATKVDGPDSSLFGLASVDLREEALLEPADADAFAAAASAAGGVGVIAEGDSIVMTHYAPNELRYHYTASEPLLALFSEVYYPEGWHAWLADTPESNPSVDATASQKAHAAAAGVDVPVFRADWIFRAAVLPAGEHDLIMRYDPKSNKVSADISRASSAFIILVLLLAVAGVVVFERKEN